MKIPTIAAQRGLTPQAAEGRGARDDNCNGK
jgi:hypothetical protein